MGQSSSQTTQQTSTNPWAAAMPEVSGLLSGVSSLLPNTGVNPTEQSAINQLTGIGQAGNPYAAGTSGAVDNLLAGGGATSQVPQVQTNLDAYKAEMAPYLATNYSTVNSPQVQAALQTANDDITNQVNGQFAAAGRSGSGMNTQTLARGIAQADAPIILNQANQDTATRLGAANSVYGAGNTTAGTIAGLNQQGVNNQVAGINNAGTALSNSVWGPQTVLQTQELGQNLPASNLGLLAQIGIPLAQLGTNSSGTSTTTNNPSLLSEIGQGAQIASSLFAAPAGGTSAISGIGRAAAGVGSGLLGLLGL